MDKPFIKFKYQTREKPEFGASETLTGRLAPVHINKIRKGKFQFRKNSNNNDDDE